MSWFSRIYFCFFSLNIAVAAYILPCSGQTVKLINENEWISVNRDFLNLDNIRKEPLLAVTNVFKADHYWNILNGLLKWDVRLSGGYKLIYYNYENHYINDYTFNFEPIELYYNFYKGNWAFSVGRKKVRFGVGYVASPTDIISSPTAFDDASDRLYRILGNELAQVSYTGDGWQYDFYYLPDTKQNTDGYISDHSIAMRYYKYFDLFEISTLARADLKKRYQIGVNMTYTVGQKLELHGEGLILDRNETLYPVNGTFFSKSGIAFRGLIGGQWSPKQKWNVALEYFRLTEGYNDTEWNGLNILINEIQGALITAPQLAKEESKTLLQNLGDRAVFPTKKNYLFFRLMRTSILKKVDIEYLSFLELGDWGALHRLALVYSNKKNFELYSHFQPVTADRNSSFNTIHYYSKIRLGLRYNFSVKLKDTQ